MRGSTRFRDQIVSLLVFAEGSDDRYELPQYAEAVLLRALDHHLATPNAAEELSQVVALSIALDTELQSPAAAEQLRSLLRSDPRAVRKLEERYVQRDAVGETRRFQQQEDRAIPRPLSRSASRDAIKLSDMLDPCARTRSYTRPR